MGTKKLLIAGNWKSNKTIGEAHTWLEAFSLQIANCKLQIEKSEIVIFPSFIHLSLFSDVIQKNSLPFELGAQDISPFEKGSYTGAVAGSQLVGLASWVLIGHSERRNHFGETDHQLEQKVLLARDNGLSVLYCVPDEKTPIPPHVAVVAYEPVWAIGSGKAETPENANRVIQTIKRQNEVKTVIYGGSVTEKNVSAFVHQESIDGVLSGGASLDANQFIQLIIHASHNS